MGIQKEFENCVAIIMDDEPDNIGVAEKILEFYGAKVYTGNNGAEGLRLLETVTPTFILLDLSMPTMDGWETLKQLRSDPRWQHTPVIALTAHAMTGDKERVLEAGFNDYIAKPFRLTTFLDDIRRCLGVNGRQPVTK